jgi:S-DNA-T family DNA segregation ATPase FtsK/SpoIIIE
MRQTMEHVVRSQLGSTSMLQHAKIGLAQAGRIMDLSSSVAASAPSEGSKAREVLMTVEEFERRQEDGQL